MQMIRAAEVITAGHGGDTSADQLDEDVIIDHNIDLGTAPNSQSSSSEISIASQESQQAPISQDTSQSSTDQSQQILAASPRSQTRGSPAATLVDIHRLSPALAVKDSNARLQPTLITLDGGGESRAGYAPDAIHGQKRTASGHVKSTSSSLDTSPIEVLGHSHSRNTSTTSAGIQINELSEKLRTRLSYAMIKVQNGWQTRTIDEVESLASTQGYIVSPKQPFHSPRLERTPTRGETAGFAESSERTTAPSLASPRIYQGKYSREDLYAQRAKPSYSSSLHSRDDFRRPDAQIQTASNESGPSLAPPVDFAPRNPRRSDQPNSQASPLYLNGARNHSNLSASSTSSTRSTIPATPPQKRPPSIKTTPSATAREKDAIETLLFMSSPGNSQRHPTSSQLPGTPLRNNFLAAERHVGFIDDDSIPISPRKRGFLDSVRLQTDENIDKVLDRMVSEDSSSSEDDVLASSQQRQELYP
ncbi:hypothetical protein MMC17_002025 [Xylographa soralifera]|nr:hypothetical protein [Xylographa soralifera]